MAGYDPYADPNVNAALELTGSSYRLPPSYEESLQFAAPAPVEVPVAPVVAPPVTPVPMPSQELGEVPAPMGDVALAQQQLAPEPSPYIHQQALQEMGAAAQDQGTAAQAQAGIQSEQFSQEADVYDREQNRVDELIAKHGTAQAAQDAEYQETLEQFKRLNAQAAALPPPADRRSSNRRLVSAMAVGMGQAADHLAMVGGRSTNNAQQISATIEQGIERDIQSQRDAISKKTGEAGAALNEYALARQHFGDTEDALKFATILGKERTANELARIGASTTSALVKEQANAQAASFRYAAGKEKLAFAKSIIAKKMTPFQARMMGYSPQQTAAYNSGLSLRADGKPEVEGRAPAPVARVADGGQDDPDMTPSANVDGDMTGSQAGGVNVAAHKARAGGWRPLTPSTSDEKQTRQVQDYHANSMVYRNVLSDLETLYAQATDDDATDYEKDMARTQFNLVLDDAVTKLSVKNEQGVVTDSEFSRKLKLLGAPAGNVLQKGSNWLSDYYHGKTRGPAVFRELRKRAVKEEQVWMKSRDWTDKPEAESTTAARKQRVDAKWKPKPVSF